MNASDSAVTDYPGSINCETSRVAPCVEQTEMGACRPLVILQREYRTTILKLSFCNTL